MFSLIVCALLASSVQLPDLRKAAINGEKAMIVMPRLADELIEPVNCIAHFNPHQKEGSELLYPCGAFVRPPVGMYRFWIEQGDLISPSPEFLVWGGGAFRDRGLGAIVDVVVGGRVQLPAEYKLPPDSNVRLLHTSSHIVHGHKRRVFDRTVPAAKAHQPILMPPGGVVAMVTDSRGNVLSLFQPLTVPEKRRVPALPRLKNDSAAVFVGLQRPRLLTAERPDGVSVTLDAGNRAIEPDVLIDGADRVYAVWYAVSGVSRANLRIGSPTLGLPPEEVSLRPGTVTTVIRTLQLLPGIHASINSSDPRVLRLPKSLDVVGEGQRLVRHLELATNEARLESLPPQQLQIKLKIANWQFERKVDLQSFQDGEVVFDLRPITVTGTVYRGADTVPAEVRFYVGPEWQTAATDEQGNYEVTLWEPRTYPVEVQPVRESPPPYREYFVEIAGSQTRDFHIPDTHYVVHVTDVVSGSAIGGAEVAALNTFVDKNGIEQRASQKAVGNDRGEVQLPPLQPGSVTLVARAKNYRESEPTVATVGEDSGIHSIALALRHEDDTTRLALLLNETEAAGAEVLAIQSDDTGTVLWQSSAGSDGSLDVPNRLRGTTLLIRKSSAAVLARAWDPAGEAVTWQLQPVSSALRVKVMDAAGNPARFARMVIWLDGIPLRDVALQFAAGAAPVADQNGFWTTSKFGCCNVEILGMRRLQLPIIRQLAKSVSFPWPSEVLVQVVN